MATAGNATVQLQWNAVSGATSYNIYWATSSGQGKSGTRISVTTTSYVQGSLTNGTTYYYVVTAANAGGEGPVSSEVSATPVAPVAPVPGKTSAAGCESGPYPATNDPLYLAQWHIYTPVAIPYIFNDSSAPPSAGSDITQQTSSYSGCGVKVAVVDTGLEIAHEDLAPNVVPGASSNFTTGGNDPTNPAITGDHGTSVAGLVGARANNGLGGRGVAGDASLVGYNFISSSQLVAIELASLGGVAYSADVDVFNESYGATGLILDPTVEGQYRYGVTSLRNGNGAIYVKAAGNSFQSDPALNCALANAAGISCADASMDGENTTPYTVVVGALNAGYGGTLPAAQMRSSYSTAGSALWISAPGGEYGASNLTVSCGGAPCTHPIIDAAMITTDQSGCNSGYAVTGFNGTSTLNAFNLGGTPTQITYNPNCNYTSTFNGTSSATPVTSGAVAVLLHANPNLTWRDVKYILAKTADKVDPSAATTVTCTNGGTQSFLAAAWATTSAGFNFHPWYGFGKVNLDKAVAMATSVTSPWTPNGFGNGTAAPPNWVDTGYLPSPTTAMTGGAGPIPDCSTTGIAMNTFFATPSVTFIEAVQVNVCIRHPNVGELQFELVNVATGDDAVILPGQNGFNGVNTSTASPTACQLFLVNQFYGESAALGFQLVAKDTVTGNQGTLDAWQIRIWGH